MGELERDSLMAELQQLIQRLNERQQHVVERFFGVGVAPLTMAEIAQEMGLKRERVRQIRDQAVRHILKMTKNAELKNYLRA